MANLEENTIVNIEGIDYKVNEITTKGINRLNVELIRLVKRRYYNAQMKFTAKSKLITKELCDKKEEFKIVINSAEPTKIVISDNSFLVDFKTIILAIDKEEALKRLKNDVEEFSFKLQHDLLDDIYKNSFIKEKDVVFINHLDYNIKLTGDE